MKTVSQHPIYGEITYAENFWTGIKTITIDGTQYRVKKKRFTLGDKEVYVKGTYFTGAQLVIDGEAFQVSPKATWYEYVLAVLPLALTMIWGNSPYLCSILPIMGGGLGALIAAIFSCLSIALMRKAKSVAVKIIIGLSLFIASAVVSFVVALITIVLLYMI